MVKLNFRFSKLMVTITAFACLVLYPSFSSAYVIASNARVINLNAPTHLFVIGASGDGQFSRASLARASKYRKIFTKRQIVFIQSNTKKTNSFEKITGMGIRAHVENKKKLTGKKLLNLLLEYKSIASIDIFTHSNAHAGAKMDKDSDRNRFGYLTKKKLSVKLYGHFTRDAFVIFHGCNMGWLHAPSFAARWGVPVSGSLTSSEYQKVHENGNWYFRSERKSPTDQAWDKSKKNLYRMKPVNKPYNGQWAKNKEKKYGTGLPFYKFFCATKSTYGGIDRRKRNACYRTMALSIYFYPSIVELDANSPAEDYKEVVRDFLCPSDKEGELTSECKQALIDSERTGNLVYSPFWGRSLNCDDSMCDFDFELKYIPIINQVLGHKKLDATGPDKKTAMIEEYNRYLKGFDLIQKSHDLIFK